MKLNVCRSDYAVNYGKNIMGLPNGISDDLICARNRNPPSDTCQGMKKLEVMRRVTTFFLSQETLVPVCRC